MTENDHALRGVIDLGVNQLANESAVLYLKGWSKQRYKQTQFTKGANPLQSMAKSITETLFGEEAKPSDAPSSQYCEEYFLWIGTLIRMSDTMVTKATQWLQALTLNGTELSPSQLFLASGTDVVQFLLHEQLASNVSSSLDIAQQLLYYGVLGLWNPPPDIDFDNIQFESGGTLYRVLTPTPAAPSSREFSISTPGKTYHLRADSPEDAAVWCRSIRDAIIHAMHKAHTVNNSHAHVDNGQQDSKTTTKTYVYARVRADGPTKVLEFTEGGEEDEEYGMMPLGQISRIEESPTDTNENAVEWLKNVHLSVNLTSIGLSCVNEKPMELIYMSLQGVGLTFVRNENKMRFGVTWQDIQADNQVPEATFQTLLCSKQREVADELQQVCRDCGTPQYQAAFHFCCGWSNEQGSTDYFEYCSVYIAPILLQLDEELDDFKLAIECEELDPLNSSRLLETHTVSSSERKVYFAVLNIHPVELDITFRSDVIGDRFKDSEQLLDVFGRFNELKFYREEDVVAHMLVRKTETDEKIIYHSHLDQMVHAHELAEEARARQSMVPLHRQVMKMQRYETSQDDVERGKRAVYTVVFTKKSLGLELETDFYGEAVIIKNCLDRSSIQEAQTTSRDVTSKLLQAGDVLIQLGDVNVRNIGFRETIALIKGSSRPVTLTFESCDVFDDDDESPVDVKYIYSPNAASVATATTHQSPHSASLKVRQTHWVIITDKRVLYIQLDSDSILDDAILEWSVPLRSIHSIEVLEDAIQLHLRVGVNSIFTGPLRRPEWKHETPHAVETMNVFYHAMKKSFRMNADLADVQEVYPSDTSFSSILRVAVSGTTKRRRWCVLSRNCLYVFAMYPRKTLRLVVPLGRVAVTKDSALSWKIQCGVQNETIPVLQVDGPSLSEKMVADLTLITEKPEEVEMWMSALQHAAGKGMRHSKGTRFYAATGATMLSIGCKETKAYVVVQLVDALKKTLAVFKEG
ncbi:hypothetical protein DYB32_000306 [Aphanomyces invadans]|uniref:PH domain-containing protein n=1 Tax=Aphanomyces invadans TaxID=157072 RepID=A0A3R6YH14_9STRA|nr:hypothetical protein DYB32_000306 [Aphanomyces invadans]